ncbi:MAG: sigma factor-like helix-turn-helix DNA-binding protein [Chitinophaga rupis]|jgi:DNA-directed RNA polymerase specialized sigma24 family protein
MRNENFLPYTFAVMELNTNRQRRDCWEKICGTFSRAEIEKALDDLEPITARVLRLHYLENYPLTEIGSLIGRSVSVVRNHQRLGIYRLSKYFNL